MEKTKTPLKEILAWVAFFIFLIYLFLRLAGILNSPIIADLLGVGSIGYFIGIQVQKLNRLIKDVYEVKQELRIHIENKESHQYKV